MEQSAGVGFNRREEEERRRRREGGGVWLVKSELPVRMPHGNLRKARGYPRAWSSKARQVGETHLGITNM